MKKLPEGWAFYDKMLPVFGVGTNRILSSYKKSRTGRAFLRFMCGSLRREENFSCPAAFPVLAGFPPSKRP